MLLLDPPQEVEDLLRAPHGEGGDDDVAAPAQGPVDDLGQLGGVAPHLLVVPVAVGGLHDHVVRPLEQHRVPDDGLVDVADVSGEDDGLPHVPFMELHRNGSGAQQVARVGKGGGHALAHADLLVVLAGMDVGHGAHGVLHGVDGLHKGTARALVAAVVVLCVGHLDVGAVHQHDLHEPRGKAGGPDLALEAVLDEHGDAARVVDMGVGHQDVVDGVGLEGQLMVVDLVPPLLQAAVDQDSLPVDLKAVTAAGHTLVRSVKVQFHEKALLVFVYHHCITSGGK